MNRHKDVEFVQFHVRLPKELVEKFQAVRVKHKTTDCALIHALMQATVKGDELGVIKIGSENPSIIQIVEQFASRPRGHGKYDTTSMPGFEPEAPSVYCVFCGGFSGGLVFCQRHGSDWLPASRCADCPSNWFKKQNL
jgi:hypothetical protein